MLFKGFIGWSVFSLAFFAYTAMTGAKGPQFDMGGTSSGGRSSTGYHSIWHGGK